LKYFKHMLLGHEIILKTDHKNLTYPTSTHTSDRVLRQRLLLEEYGVKLEYIKGEKNIVADAFSRLPTEELFQFDENEDFPLNLPLLADSQTRDEYLQHVLAKQPDKFVHSFREGSSLYVKKDTAAIYVPATRRPAILQWYHTTLQHPGIKRMQATLRENFYWPGMDAAVEHLVHTCATCQKCKLTAVKKYGKIPSPTNQHIGAWEEVHVDLIGPWDVRYNSSGIPGRSIIEKIHALEFLAIQNKTSHHVALRFDGEWLCCFPRPARVIFDNETEFTGSELQELLSSYGIKPVPTTVRNPRSNGVIERVHLTMGDMLQTMTFSGSDWFADMQCALDAVAWAICTMVNPNI
jgi:hypothetical protein